MPVKRLLPFHNTVKKSNQFWAGFQAITAYRKSLFALVRIGMQESVIAGKCLEQT